MTATRGGSSPGEPSASEVDDVGPEPGRPPAIPSIPPPTDEIDEDWGAPPEQTGGAPSSTPPVGTPGAAGLGGDGSATSAAEALAPTAGVAQPSPSPAVVRIPSRQPTQLGMAAFTDPCPTPTRDSSPGAVVESRPDEALDEPGRLRPSEAAPLLRERRRTPATVPPLDDVGRPGPGAAEPLPSRRPTQLGFASPVGPSSAPPPPLEDPSGSARPPRVAANGQRVQTPVSFPPRAVEGLASVVQGPSDDAVVEAGRTPPGAEGGTHPASAGRRPRERAAALAAELDRLTAEAPLTPAAGAEPSPALASAPPARAATSTPPSSPPRSVHPSLAPSIPAPSPAVRVLRPLLLVAAVAVGVTFIWVALRPPTSDGPRPSSLEGARSDLLAPPVPERPSAPPTRGRPLAPRPVEPSTSAEAASAAASAAEPDGGSTVRVVIRTKPDGARFFLDGKRVGKAPFTVDLPRGKVRRYSVWLEGYGTRAVVVDGSDREILLGLVREAPQATPDR